MSEKPKLTVIKGNPDDSQVAALTAVFTGIEKAAEEKARQERLRPRSNWGNLEEHLGNRPTSFNPASFRNVNYF